MGEKGPSWGRRGGIVLFVFYVRQRVAKSELQFVNDEIMKRTKQEM